MAIVHRQNERQHTSMDGEKSTGKIEKIKSQHLYI